MEVFSVNFVSGLWTVIGSVVVLFVGVSKNIPEKDLKQVGCSDSSGLFYAIFLSSLKPKVTKQKPINDIFHLLGIQRVRLYSPNSDEVSYSLLFKTLSEINE